MQRLADLFQVPGRFNNVSDLLQEANPDIVLVCVPAQSHVEVALQVLDAGKHLMVEKPLALDLAGCDELISASSGVNSRKVVGFNLRFHRLVLQAREIIASGQLGEIEAIRSCWTSAVRYKQKLPAWRNSRETGGGALFEIAVHHIDLWRYLLGLEIEQVHCYSQSLEFADESVVINARMRNGTLASGVFSEHTSDANQLEILGRNGRLSISLFQYDGLEFNPILSEPGLRNRMLQLSRKVSSIPKGISIMRKGGDFLLSYQESWRQYLDSLRSGVSPHASLKDGRTAIEVVLACCDSAGSGKAVYL